MAPTERATSVLKLYCATSGFNGMFTPSHVFAWRLERDDTALCSSKPDDAELIPGSIDKGFYGALLEALHNAPAGSHIQIVAPRGSELYWVFKQSLEDRQRAAYRTKAKKGKSLRPNHELQRQVDAYCLAQGITLTADEPQTNHEIETRYSVEDEARQRLRDACAASETA